MFAVLGFSQSSRRVGERGLLISSFLFKVLLDGFVLFLCLSLYLFLSVSPSTLRVTLGTLSRLLLSFFSLHCSLCSPPFSPSFQRSLFVLAAHRASRTLLLDLSISVDVL
jgi:hypothetical protein